MSGTDFSSFKQLFNTSSSENLQQLKTAMSGLSQNPTDSKALELAHRMAHSLKGECLAMQYMSTGTLCRIIEHIFFKIQGKTLVLSDELLNLLQKAADSIEKSLKRIEIENIEEDLTQAAEELKKV